MLPRDFARAVVPHGTLAVVSDPHEIANVCGLDGIRFMLAASAGLPLDVRVMLSSCVPATHMETAGARLLAADLATLAWEDRVLGIAEVMNYPGVIGAAGRPVAQDRPRPGRRAAGGRPRPRRARARHRRLRRRGHHLRPRVVRCWTRRRRSCAWGFHVLVPRRLDHAQPGRAAAADHPAAPPRIAPSAPTTSTPTTSSARGTSTRLCARPSRAACDPALAVQCASYNTARHYGFADRGAIAPGYRADLLVVDRFPDFNVTRVYRAGELVAEDGRLLVDPPPTAVPAALPDDAPRIPPRSPPMRRAPRAGGAAATGSMSSSWSPTRLLPGAPSPRCRWRTGLCSRTPARTCSSSPCGSGIRRSGRVGVGFVRGFGLRRGALASSVAHDSHNIVVVGTDDADMRLAARLVAEMGGGQVAVADGAGAGAGAARSRRPDVRPPL